MDLVWQCCKKAVCICTEKHVVGIDSLLEILQNAQFDIANHGEEAKRGFDNAITRMTLYLQQEKLGQLKIRKE
jgi:hypothetical protein